MKSAKKEEMRYIASLLFYPLTPAPMLLTVSLSYILTQTRI